jgi:periodic tryptophan protein 1
MRANIQNATDDIRARIFLPQAIMASLISAVSWVRRGVSAQRPQKYVLDDAELQRVSALARIEVEDARVELERAHRAAQSMHQEAPDEGNEDDEDGDETDWVE